MKRRNSVKRSAARAKKVCTAGYAGMTKDGCLGDGGAPGAEVEDFRLDPGLALGLPGLLLLDAVLDGLLALRHRVDVRIELDVVLDPVGGELRLRRRQFLLHLLGDSLVLRLRRWSGD